MSTAADHTDRRHRDIQCPLVHKTVLYSWDPVSFKLHRCLECAMRHKPCPLEGKQLIVNRAELPAGYAHEVERARLGAAQPADTVSLEDKVARASHHQ